MVRMVAYGESRKDGMSLPKLFGGCGGMEAGNAMETCRYWNTDSISSHQTKEDQMMIWPRCAKCNRKLRIRWIASWLWRRRKMPGLCALCGLRALKDFVYGKEEQ